MTRAATFKEDKCHPPEDADSSTSLAAQAIRASAAHRDSSYANNSAFHSSFKHHSKVLFSFDCINVQSNKRIFYGSSELIGILYLDLIV